MAYSSGSVRWVGSIRPHIPKQIDRDGSAQLVWDIVESSIENDKPLLITGDVGVGKTTIMAYIERGINIRYPAPRLRRERHSWLDDPSWWMTASDWLYDVREGWIHAKRFRDDWGPRFDAKGLAGTAKRLFIDDLGTESITRAENIELLNELVDERYRRRLPTWITTNLDDAALVDRYGRRTVSRLLETNEILYVPGNDRRTLRR